jgi:hypothetical protein
MERWKSILATATLLVATSGGAMAEQQPWRDRRDRDDGYSQRYERRRMENRYQRGQYGYRDHDGDRDDGYWRQRGNRNYNRHSNRGYEYGDRDRDRD